MENTRQWLAIGLVLTLAFGLAACNRERIVEAARENVPPSVSDAEQDFMMKASETHLAEISSGRVVLQKSDNVDVRDYANMMVRDHGAALEELADLMVNKNVKLSNTVAAELQKDINRMNALTGPELDREFMNMMVAEHLKAIELFRDSEETAQNPDVKKYIDDMLPRLEMHLDKAQQLQSKLFGSSRR
jgi:putative membrane protein